MSHSDEPFLFPRPQEIKMCPDQFPRPSNFPYFVEDHSLQVSVSHLLNKGLFQVETVKEALFLVRREKLCHPEAYRLKITPSRVILSGNQPVAIFHGIQTFLQILDSHEYGPNLPCLEIEDFPVLDRRGFMLDVSRCKVPTMETLYSLIDLLSRLHINELQLYIEHTFAFKEHNQVWQNASPFTAEEIQLIDRYCEERFIELVPNLNSFGHFERWLMHDQYKHLAECPDGFKRENPYILRDHGTTLKPNQESLDFIDSLYTEYLPNFSSKKFNVGMDEPWELGQGWSREKVEKIGKDKVYLAHLEGIRQLVEAHGKEMQFWADVLLENPENARLLPMSASPIIWGYEPSHPFEEQACAIASCGLSYCLAPGTGTWRSFSGRWESARENIDLAIDNARRHNAQGILLTSWGDCGNHQPWSTLYPPLLYGAAKAWNEKSLDENALNKGLLKLVSEKKENSSFTSIIKLGKLDRIIGSEIPNTSLCWFILFAPLPHKLAKFIHQNHSLEQLEEGISFLDSIENPVPSFSPPSSLVESEIYLGIELSKLALQKGIALLRGNQFQKLPKDHDFFSFFQELWLARAREGGCDESIELLREAVAIQ